MANFDGNGGPMSGETPYLGQNCVTPYTRTEVFRRLLWALIEATVFRWSPRPWHGFRARLLRLFGADISAPGEVVIFPSARITFPWKLTLESRAMIGPGVILYNLGPITIQRGANISQYCHLCSGTHDFTRWSMPLVTKPILIGPNAWLAADVFVGPGVKIGELCVVGARSVVIRDLPDRKICVGNPCRPMRDRPLPSS